MDRSWMYNAPRSRFRPEYLKWVYHGEGTTPASNSTTLNKDEDILHHEMCDLLNDAFEAEGEDGMDVHENASNSKNSYENARRMRILENERKMKALGITNIAMSLKSKPESQKIQQTKVRPHFIPPMYMNRVVNQVKLRQPVGSNAPQKFPLTKDNKGEKRKLVLVDEYDDEDDENFQDDESQEISDALQRNNQYETEMAKCFKSKNNGICKRKRLQMVTTPTVFDELIGDPVHDDHGEDNQVSETQVHQTSDIPACGDEANELAQFLGTLVRMPDHVSIEYPDWRKVPAQNKEDMYSLVKTKFVFHPNETNDIKKWILYSMRKKWRAWKGSLKARLYDPSLTVDEIVAQQVKHDNRVSQTQFKELATRWVTPKFQGRKDVRVTDFSNLVDTAV
ncbi:hypothetical protein E3N88_31597 [Mikania micrantha]|uniref:Uncharacterized protein n=1 Tax=Mikania micrantha TaxID=192012 RepID=A0A5N6M8R0_9ASTR|nr:hypothetical protein E3N88_31597 [Mikania micrantha]